MTEATRCPKCHTDLTGIVRQVAMDYIQDWKSRALITGEQAELLRDDVQRPAASGGGGPAARWPGAALTPSMALLLIGGILVVSAVVMVATELWQDLTPFGRFAVVAVPTMLFYALAGIFRLRQLTSDWVAAGFALMGASMAPFVVWLALGMTKGMHAGHAAEAGWVAASVAIGLVVQIATLAWLRAAALTVPPSITAVWLAGSLAEWLWSGPRSGASITVALVIAGIALMAAGQAFWRSDCPRHAIAPNLIGVGVALFGLTVLAEEQKSIYEALSLAAPVGLIIAACRPQYRPYLWAGATFLVINTFRVGLAHFASTLGLPIAVMMCGLVSIVTGYVVHRVRREYAR